MRRLHLAHALLPEGLRRNVSLTLDEEGTVLEVGRAEEALALQAHLPQCAACQQAKQSFHGVSAALSLLEDPPSLSAAQQCPRLTGEGTF